MNIQNNLDKLRNQISKNVNIVIVSKTQSTDKILEAYYIVKFGENKVQELVEHRFYQKILNGIL